jgi:hypothetical protein
MCAQELALSTVLPPDQNHHQDALCSNGSSWLYLLPQLGSTKSACWVVMATVLPPDQDHHQRALRCNGSSWLYLLNSPQLGSTQRQLHHSSQLVPCQSDVVHTERTSTKRCAHHSAFWRSAAEHTSTVCCADARVRQGRVCDVITG